MVNQPHNGTHLPDTRAGRGGEPQPVQPLVVSVKVCQRMLGDIDRKSVDKLIAEERLIAFRLSDRPRPGRHQPGNHVRDLAALNHTRGAAI